MVDEWMDRMQQEKKEELRKEKRKKGGKMKVKNYVWLIY